MPDLIVEADLKYNTQLRATASADLATKTLLKVSTSGALAYSTTNRVVLNADLATKTLKRLTKSAAISYYTTHKDTGA